MTQFLIRHHQTNIGIRKDVSADTPYKKIRVVNVTVGSLLHFEHSDSVLARAARQPGAAENRNRIARVGESDRATEKKGHVIANRIGSGTDRLIKRRAAGGTATAPKTGIRSTELENAGVLEKEVAFFREEQAVALQAALLFMRF